MSTEQTTASKARVMSGMRPTGRLHLGHYLGVLKNWVVLQDQYDCFFSIADWHALTTKADATGNLVEDIYQIALDWLGAGLDPARCTIYVQSGVLEIAELHLLLSMITPNKWCETDPTLKDMVQIFRQKPADATSEEADEAPPAEAMGEALSYGLLGYPVLQSADILGPLASLVPIGQDQLAHLEITRDIARRFNHWFETDLFPEPKPLLTEVPRLIGLDGRKMSKSYNNAIYLSDTDEATLSIIKTAVTDPARVKRADPGNPALCQAIYPYYEVFADDATRAVVAEECRTAARGCMDCKRQLAEIVNESLRPLRERRALYASDRAQVEAILKTGTERARAIHQDTLRQVRQVMRLFQLG